MGEDYNFDGFHENFSSKLPSLEDDAIDFEIFIS